MNTVDAVTPPVFPGATSVSELEVYDGVASDGLAGGTPHLHIVSAEAYLVIGGRGRLQTIDGSGLFEEHRLEPGELIWFDPGVIHRVVNDGALEVRVIMQNAGLPEAGDAVMTFPDEVLADPARYRSAASLPAPDRPDGERLAAAHRRRDLAVDGFLALFLPGGAVDRDRLARLHDRAVALVVPHVSEWRERWRTGAFAAAQETAARLDALSARGAPSNAGIARDVGLARARVASAPSAATFGMCGRLHRYETQPEQPAIPKETDV